MRDSQTQLHSFISLLPTNVKTHSRHNLPLLLQRLR